MKRTSNSTPDRSSFNARIHELLRDAGYDAFKSLEKGKLIGSALIDGGALHPRSELTWAKDEFGFSRSRVANYKTLVIHWDEIALAFDWANRVKHPLARQGSPDAAARLLRAYRNRDAQPTPMPAKLSRYEELLEEVKGLRRPFSPEDAKVAIALAKKAPRSAKEDVELRRLTRRRGWLLNDFVTAAQMSGCPDIAISDRVSGAHRMNPKGHITMPFPSEDSVGK